MEDVNIGKWITGGVIGLVVLILLLGSIGTISTGKVGIKTRFGGVVGTLQQGLYFKTPLIDHVHSMDIQTQKEQATAQAASKDLQTVSAVVAVNYNVVSSKAADLYTRVGTDYSARVIDPAIQEVVKATTARYTAEELITKRPEVTEGIQTSLAEKLAQNDILVTSVSIVNFDFSKTFNEAIEAKVTAEQNALAAKNKLDQVKYEADQRVAQAKGEAEAIRIQSQAIESQGGQNYVQLQAIKQWDGHLPQQMIPGSTVPFLNLNK